MRTVTSEISACKQVIELWSLVRDLDVLGAYSGFELKTQASGILGMDHYIASCPCCEFDTKDCEGCPMHGFWRGDGIADGECLGGIFGAWQKARLYGERVATAQELVEAAREALAYWQAMREMNQQ